MWYKTDLMEQILTSESAKQMIDYVSPIYGKSRIGLWLFQVIGLEIDDVKTICEDIFDQIFVDRATWGLPIWEKEYGITPLPDQTIEQRRTQILQMRIKRPLNPKRFEKIIEALSGVETKLIENTAKNTFQVNLYGEVNNYDEVVRRIDDLGRIVLPKELRRTMRIKEGESLEIYTDGTDRIILKKYSPVQNVNDFVEEFVESVYASNKRDIIITDNEKVIAYAGNFKTDLSNKRISMRLEEKMSKRQTQVIDKAENFEFLENFPISKAAIIKPINVMGDISGSVIVLSDTITDVEKSLAEFGGMFMGRYLEG